MIHFLAGLPRSGSSLLASLLGQHPQLHATPTSGLADLVQLVRSSWTSIDAFRAEGLEKLSRRVSHAIGRMIQGFHAANHDDCSVLDKSRLWLPLIEVVEQALGRRVNVVCPVRSVRAIVGSFENLWRKHPMTSPDGHTTGRAQHQDAAGRAAWMLAEDGVVGLAARRLSDAYDRGLEDRLIIVPFEMLTQRPRQVCDYVFGELGLEPFDVSPFGASSWGRGDMDVWGLPLHHVPAPVTPRVDPRVDDPQFPFVEMLARLRRPCRASEVLSCIASTDCASTG